MYSRFLYKIREYDHKFNEVYLNTKIFSRFPVIFFYLCTISEARQVGMELCVTSRSSYSLSSLRSACGHVGRPARCGTSLTGLRCVWSRIRTVLLLSWIRWTGGCRALRNSVPVTARRELITADADKLTYNVEADPLAAGSNLIDILRNVPKLSINGDEEVSDKL